MRAGPRRLRTASFFAGALLAACTAQTPGATAASLPLLTPDVHTPWRGTVTLFFGPLMDGSIPARVEALSIDGVSRPVPEIDPDGPPMVGLDTRPLADGPHALSAQVLWSGTEHTVSASFQVANGPAVAPPFTGRLVEVTEAAGLGPPLPPSGEASGAIALQVGSDPYPAIFAWKAGEAWLYRRTGPWRYAGERVPGLGRVAAAGAGDLDGDGRADLVVAGDGLHVLRGTAGGLVDVTATAGLPAWAASGQQFVGVTLADLDDDGLTDVGVAQMACGHGANVVLHNEGGLVFRDVAPAMGLDLADGATYAFALDSPQPGGPLEAWSFEEGCTPTQTNLRLYRRGDGLPQLVDQVAPFVSHTSPMGSARLDLGTGRLDLWSAGDLLNLLWPPPTYQVDESAAAGLQAWVDSKDRFVSAWAMVLFDADFDGRADVFVVHDPSNPADQGHRTPGDALYWQQARGHFVDVAGAAGLAPGPSCRAAQGADLDLDGDVDLLVGCRDGVHLFRNDLVDPAPGRTLVLVGRASNPDGLNARLRTPSGEWRLVRGGGQTYAGGVVHESVAVGDGRVEVDWPSGWVQQAQLGSDPVQEIVEPVAVRVTPRRLAPGGMAAVEVDGAGSDPVSVSASGGTFVEPMAAGTDGVWRGELQAPGAAGDVVLTVTIGAKTLFVRPRVYVR